MINWKPNYSEICFNYTVTKGIQGMTGQKIDRKWILSSIALLVVFVFGILAKGKIDSLFNGTNIAGKTQETAGGDIVRGDKSTQGDNTGGNKTVYGQQENRQENRQESNVQIIIQQGDERYKNSSQPNLSDPGLAEVKPVELGSFKGANQFTKETVLPDYLNNIVFSDGKIAISDRIYDSIFKLRGENQEQKVVFSLSGNQKGIFLQFGLKDLAKQGDNLIYEVIIFTTNNTEKPKKVWSGKIIYGSKDQIVSLPFDATKATSLIIKYSISQGKGNTNRELFFTRAELLYE
ncbi:hypothetical protein BMF77_00068 [Dolichospermum sp. UHCC 0315A]|jgi:hypothetical protein|nr:hypothetical protein BMF77_00068 [Dolichospermum sp. UHCC 0315A]